MVKTSIINIFFMVLIMPALVISSNVLPQNKKVAHLHFYLHSVVSGNKPTEVIVANAPNSNGTITFGTTWVMDDLLTTEPELSSKQVGRAQGMYSLATVPTNVDSALLMMINFVFTEGKYNGSTLSMLGRDDVPSKVKEVAIVGGTGYFRSARGYALGKIYFFNVSVGDAIVEYNIYVFH